MDNYHKSSATWLSAALSDKGNVRRINEDSVLALPSIGLWAVADGMGGHTAGDVASQMIVSSLQKIQRPSLFQDFVDRVEETLLNVNQEIFNYARTNYAGKVLGSTVVALLLENDIGICLWAGDSRLYRLRNSQLTQLSVDHSAVQELYRQGKITAEELDTHPSSNVITRAIGAHQALHVEPYLFEVKSNDIYLLCSDGLYNELSTQEIKECLSSDINASAHNLIEETLLCDARDNVSVVVVKVH